MGMMVACVLSGSLDLTAIITRDLFFSSK